MHDNLSPRIIMALLTSFILMIVIWCSSLLLKKFSKNAQNTQTLSLPPGPKGIPILGNLPFLHPELHSYFTTLAKTYGPIFSLRLGNKIAIVISTPLIAREVLKDKDIIFSNRDVPIAAKVVFYGGCDILWSSYGPEWRMLRKIFTREMFTRTMLDFVNKIRGKEIRRMVNHLWIKRMSLVDVREEIFTTVLNSITNILWGGGENETGKRSFEPDFHLYFEEMSVLLGKANISDFIPCLAYFDLQGIEKQLKGINEKFDKVFELMINERMGNDDNDKMDFLQVLLNLRKGGDGKTPLTTAHVKGILMDMVLGGTDTTSNTIEFALAEMMNNPRVMKEAQMELEVVVGKNNMVEESHIAKLHYLYAIMKETLRLYPGGTLLVPHCPSESSTIGGYAVPKSARVFINVWAIHRDPSIWEDPLKFIPERFIRSEWNYNGNDFNYFPFGSGRRICVGIQLGEKMFMIFLASLIHYFDWKVTDGDKVNLEEKFGLALRKKKPLMAIPIPRLSNPALYH